jgi:hypothetical protein
VARCEPFYRYVRDVSQCDEVRESGLSAAGKPFVNSVVCDAHGT